MHTLTEHVFKVHRLFFSCFLLINARNKVIICEAKANNESIHHRTRARRKHTLHRRCHCA